MNIRDFLKKTKLAIVTIFSLLTLNSCQQQNTSSEHNNIEANTTTATRDIVMMVNLVKDSAALREYDKYHAKVWPEIIQASKAAGYKKIDIYRLSDKLVMILTVPKDWDGDKANEKYLSASPRVREWLDIMEKYQIPSPEAPKGTTGWTTMKNVFSYKEGKQIFK